MSEEESAAMDGLAAEMAPEGLVEAAEDQPVQGEEDSAASENAAETDIGDAAAEAATAAEAEAAVAASQDGSADANRVAEQQKDDSSTQGAEPDSTSSLEAQAAAVEAAVAAAEEEAQQQPEPATEAETEHAPEPAPSSTVSSTEGATTPQPEATSKQPQPVVEQQPRQSTHSQASRPASSSHAAASPEHKPAAAVEAAATPAPAKQRADEEEAAPAAHVVSSKPHKETTVERLTTPTAMRMLKTLQQTQGDKTDWHIASGVVYKSKKLAPDEMAAMVDRLCVAKHKDDDMPPKLHAVKLVYDDNGREVYEPVKEVTKQENISYMAELYSRCQETRAKNQQQLAEKYLQPLVVLKAKSPAKTDKAPAAEKA